MCYNLTGVVYQPPPWVINTMFCFRRCEMRLLRTPWVELRRERDGARVMETVVSYPGVKNCTAQRVMYIERPRVAEKRAYKYKYGGKYGYKYSYSDPYEAQ